MSFIRSRKKLVSTALLSSVSALAINSHAADQPIQLETITVTAEAEQGLKADQSANRKFVAPLLDTPKTVDVIPQQLLQDTNVSSLADALRTVPGITLGAGEGGNPNGDRPFIRGFNSESSLYVDGVRNASSQVREVFALEQVEVTKGSSSALGGGGSVGGSINLISKVAKAGDAFEGTFQNGTADYTRIVLDGNKDFGNGVAARVVAMGHQSSKAGQSNGAEYKRAGITPSITVGLNSPTRATLSYYYLKTDDIPDSGVPYWTWTNATKTEGKAIGKPLDAPQGIYYGWKDRDFQKQENQIGTLKVEHDFTDDITLSNTAAYSKSKNNYLWTQPDDSQGNVLNGQVWRRANTRITDTATFNDQLNLTAKFNTANIKHSLNFGGEYSRQETDKSSYTLNPSLNAKDACANGNTTGWCTSAYHPNPNDPWLGSITAKPKGTTTTTTTQSVYLLDNIALHPQWLLDLGIRWDKFDTKQVDNSSKTQITSDTDFFSYQAGITFKPTENGSIYASYATSANPVGVDAGDGSEGIGQAYANLKPEESRTLEIGTKWNVLNDNLFLTAAVFRTEKNNARVQLDSNTYTNIGKARTQGVELGISGNITDKWDIAAGYTYLDSENIEPGANCSRRGCTAGENPAKGKRLPNTPQNSFALWTNYQVLPQLTLGVGATAMDKVYGDAANTKWVPGYVRYDAMARYDVNPHVNLQLNVNNITDKRYFTKAYASHYATEGEGRNAILALNLKY